MSKSNHRKKVIEGLKAFRKDFRLRQELSDEIQTIIYFIKDKLQTSIENIISYTEEKEKIFWFYGDGLEKPLTMNPMEKHITKMNTRLDNMTYPVDNQNVCANITN